MVHESVLIVFVGFFALMGWMTWRSRRHSGSALGFVIGNRSTGVLGTSASQFVSIFDGTGFILMVLLGVTLGAGMTWLLVGIAVPYFLLAIHAGRIRRLAGERRYVTVSDLLNDRIGPRTAMASAILISLVMFLAMPASLQVVGVMIGSLLGIPMEVALIGTAALIATYVTVGGYKAVIRTDVLQASAVVLFAVTAYTIGTPPTLHEGAAQIANTPLEQGVGLMLLLFFTNYGYLDTWQRIFSAKTPAVARKATLLTGAGGLVINASFVFFGVAVARAYPQISADRFVHECFSNPTIAPWLAGVVGVTLLSLVMSTLDSRAYTVTSTVVTNVMRIDPEEQPARYITALRVLSVVVFALLCVIAIAIPDVLEYIINVTSVTALFAPVLFGAASSQSSRTGVFRDRAFVAVLVVGTVVWAGMWIGGLFTNYLWNLVPVLVTSVLTAIAFGFDPRGGFRTKSGYPPPIRRPFAPQNLDLPRA